MSLKIMKTNLYKPMVTVLFMFLNISKSTIAAQPACDSAEKN